MTVGIYIMFSLHMLLRIIQLLLYLVPNCVVFISNILNAT